MSRDRVSFGLISLAAVAVHAGIVALMLRVAALHDRLPRLMAERPESDWVIHRSEATPPLPTPTRVEPPPPEMPKIEEPALGEHNGTGDSISSMDLPDVARSPTPHDFEQAWTRREATAVPPPPPPPPQQAAAVAQSTPEGNRAEEDGDAEQLKQQSATALPFGSIAIAAKPASAMRAVPQPGEDDVTEKPRVGTDSPMASVQPQPQPPAETAAPAKPVLPTPSAEPQLAPQAASDIDPFAKEEGVDFTPGGVKARQGRKVNLVRPRIDLGFMADATALYGRGISVTMRIETDANGKPRNVIVTKGSGSDTIDDAVRVAAFDSWFGPPMSDRFTFSVRFLK